MNLLTQCAFFSAQYLKLPQGLLQVPQTIACFSLSVQQPGFRLNFLQSFRPAADIVPGSLPADAAGFGDLGE